MLDRYEPGRIEPKWQARWERDDLYRTPEASPKEKYYFLTMYPYPSGDLHIGHWYAEAPADAKARYMRMRGYNVLFPIGFDAFGLPAENAAIRQGIHPFQWTMANIERMRRQLRSLGAMFDWSREIITCLPEYYRWNQWLFLQFYRNGLAYRQLASVDWCPSCNTTLAREQVVGDERRCERCDTAVIKRDLEQWFFRITKYAEELLNFEGLDWPERVRTMQANWIGRSEGAEIAFGGPDGSLLWVFTTRPDTIYGATYIVVAPEHPRIAAWTTPEHRTAVEEYVQQARRRSEIDRLSVTREKTGRFLGTYCTNPYSGARIPVYVADYVLASYGTGAVMGVPAHDARDFLFARQHELPVRVVICPPGWHGTPLSDAYTGKGQMINSGPFDGLDSGEGQRKVTRHGAERGFARDAVTYRLRDWLISRQRYWGTPIPVVYCEACGTVPIPEEQLPVVLPRDADFMPTGESPLKFHEAFRRVACPTCGRQADRETDTMDTFVDSSWYQYRYLSPHYSAGPFDPARVSWVPVDQYTGGIEHATMHLLYFRFFTKALRDLGIVPFGEPVRRLMNQGMILGADAQKMSKSRGNVVNPDDIVATAGADAFRCYLMFIGPWQDGGPYRPKGIDGITRWLNRIWTLVLTGPATSGSDDTATRALRRATHRAIRTATGDMEAFCFNTLLSCLMTFTNELGRVSERGDVSRDAWDEATEALLLMMAPLAPHFAEELWERTGRPYSIHDQAWPVYDASLVSDDQATVVIQINGKFRDRIVVPADATEQEVRQLALARERLRLRLDGSDVGRVVYVPGRLLNFVMR